MGRVKIMQASLMATIQDFGRFGYRHYGIPQSGAMDRMAMIEANRQVGNPDHYPVVEYALMGMSLQAKEETRISIVGASVWLNDEREDGSCILLKGGDILKLSRPLRNYAYFSMGGGIAAQKDFGSYATHIASHFGGLQGRALISGDILHAGSAYNTKGLPPDVQTGVKTDFSKSRLDATEIRMMKGPEWSFLKELPTQRIFQVDASSDRMGVRLSGTPVSIDDQEIKSSAVVPGTIQLPPNGLPIVLMNDCQTTGGYPRIGKVWDADLGKLAQATPDSQIYFIVVEF